jgi:hypothetical protein
LGHIGDKKEGVGGGGEKEKVSVLKGVTAVQNSVSWTGEASVLLLNLG